MANPHAPETPSLRAALPPLGAMFLFQVLATASALALPVFAVELAADVGVSPGWVGLYMSVVFAAAMAGAIVGGRLVIRLGAVRVAQICLGLAAAGLGLMTLGVLPAVVAGALAVGLAYGPPTPASSHVLSRSTPLRLMPLVFSLKQTGVPAGGMLAGAAIPPLVLVGGWRGAALAVAGAALAVALALQPLRARLDADRDPRLRLARNPLEPLRLVLGEPRMRRMALLSFAYSSVQMSLVAFLVTYLVEGVGLRLVAAGMVLASAQAAGVAGRVLWGAVSGVGIPARGLLVALGVVMAGASVATAMVAPGWPLAAVIAVSVLFGATAIGWNGVYLAELARIAPPGQAGLATGGSVSVTFAGVVLAPAAFSAILAAGLGFAGGFVMLAAMALAGAALMLRRD